MNKLLRNPWVVAALVISMAALWWVQMRTIFFPGGLSEEVPAEVVVVSETVSEPLPGDDASAVETLTIVPLSEHELKATALRWDSVPARDPFGPLRKPVTTVLAAPEVLTPNAPVPAVVVPSVPVMPTLEAVLNTPSAHIAVIDGHMVRVGDRVRGRAVLKIDNASVALGRSAEADPPLLLKLPSR